MKFDLCPVSDIPAEGSKVVDFFGRTVHVVRGEGDALTAFMDVCMHLGGPLVVTDGNFQCQWHAAVFDRSSGRSLCGPAPEGSQLLRLPVRVEGGVLQYVYGDDAGA